MIENVLQEIGGVGIYGIISISLFFLVFAAMLIRTSLMKKSFLDSMSALPLRDEGEITPKKGDSHHE